MENKEMTMEAFGETYTVKSYAESILRNAQNRIIRYEIKNMSILDMALRDIDEHISWYSGPFFKAVKEEIKKMNYGK